MHRSEANEFSTCAACGAQVRPSVERGYLFEGQWALCWRCALDRGGVYEEERDRWRTPPDTADLPRNAE